MNKATNSSLADSLQIARQTMTRNGTLTHLLRTCMPLEEPAPYYAHVQEGSWKGSLDDSRFENHKKRIQKCATKVECQTKRGDKEPVYYVFQEIGKKGKERNMFVGYAHHLNVCVFVPLIENGENYRQCMLGDREWYPITCGARKGNTVQCTMDNRYVLT